MKINCSPQKKIVNQACCAVRRPSYYFVAATKLGFSDDYKEYKESKLKSNPFFLIPCIVWNGAGCRRRPFPMHFHQLAISTNSEKSNIRHEEFRLSFVTLIRPLPLDSEMGWTGELWSNINIRGKTKKIAILLQQKYFWHFQKN